MSCALTYYVKKIELSVEFYKKSLHARVINKNENSAYSYAAKEDCFIKLEEENEEKPTLFGNCKRCNKELPKYKLKYDDFHIDEAVCRDCCGWRNCEICNRKFDIDSLYIDEDNYNVCKKCYDYKMYPCKKCEYLFYSYDLNYQRNNVYFCDFCEEQSMIEEENQEMDYDS